jgi:uncharacterized protein (TIGR02996 family)
VTHDDAFLHDILDHPDDDSPRLIYADWLEEHGRPARADFIRVQCELARLPKDDPRRPELEARERALLKWHEWAWAGSLLRLLSGTVSGWTFHRGFIEGVSLDAGMFLDPAQRFFHLTPLRHLAVSPGRNVTAQLARLPPVFARLRTLDLHGNSLGDDGARALASSANLSGLTGLTLSGNRIGNAGVQALAASTAFPRLAVLVLSGNDIENAGAQALAGSASLAGLASLEIDANPIGGEGREVLRARFGDRVHF